MRPAALLPGMVTGLVIAAAIQGSPQAQRLGVQSTTVVTKAKLLLAGDRMIYDRMYPAASIPAMPVHPDDRGMLTAALRTEDPEIRRLAIRITGRLQDPAELTGLLSFFGDRLPVIRREAADAVGRLLAYSQEPTTDRIVDTFEARLAQERDESAAHALFDTLGGLQYSGTTFMRVQKLLTSMIVLGPGRQPVSPRALMALDAIERLMQRNPGKTLAQETRVALVAMAKPVAPTMPVEAALRVLVNTGQGDREIAIYAFRFRCVFAPSAGPRPIVPNCYPSDGASGGARIRLWGLRMMDASDPSLQPFFEEAAEDSSSPDLQREAFAKLSTSGRDRIPCASLLRVLTDNQPITPPRTISVMREIDLVQKKCDELPELIESLKSYIEPLGDPKKAREWQIPARALVKLAALAPDDAKSAVDRLALRHSAWQVRVAAADASQVLQDEEALLKLADDEEPNVRSEAISALARLHSAQAPELGLRALDASDYQLITVSAVALRELPAERRLAAAVALLNTLERVTRDARDTSRVPRLEILERLKEFGRPDDQGLSPLRSKGDQLDRYLTDFDPMVASAAADAIAIWTGVKPQPRPTYRFPEQPSEPDLDELETLPKPFLEAVDGGLIEAHLVFELDDGRREFGAFNIEESPVSVARFLARARSGDFSGQTFYRGTDASTVAGSPAANDYSADDRFWRDEPRRFSGGGHMVGLVSEGTNTADGRFFVMFGPSTPFEATPIARLLNEPKPILDGTKIVRVLVPPKKMSR